MLTGPEIEEMVGDSIFSVTFVKRKDQSIREMNCRLGVKKHLNGGGPVYDAKAYQLLTVFDMQIQEYRSIPLDGILEIRANGRILKPSVDVPALA